MVSEGNISEKEKLDERVFEFFNKIWEWAENNKSLVIILCISVLIVVIIGLSVLISFLYNRVISGYITKIGPIEFSGKRKINKKINQRRITSLPAPKPSDPNEELLDEFKTLFSELKSGTRKNIVIKCSDQLYAVELGKILYHKIDTEKVGDYIGWIDYKDIETEYPIIEACMDKELIIFNDIDDFKIRISHRIGFFDNENQHTILFVNIKEYDETKDDAISRYSNLKGLSLILIHTNEVDGYDTCEINIRRGELQCQQKN